ncbi:cupin domain-containing protein [Porphyrobacter sp. CACIAM 03H1]|uniref:cupin domain-containing protein n=1 Tax=Porphyrobacter sp. CACIAM 03H1 TaxID=2003315 RepID=UPI000B5A8BAF|nr:cupin domain-containing protein [Porphyrobacter sp. CACIAM 03H1]ASJ90028.1 cupin [Porphyrobacter sp. CACIAM 03H1]
MSAPRLEERFVHLGLGARAVEEPPFSGMEWYEGYAARHASDGAEGRLVSQYAFSTSWTSWEMHPAGDEVVICISGAMVLVQEHPDGRIEETPLAAGEYAINPAGVWHTADVPEAASAIFITAGEGTQHRPR